MATKKKATTKNKADALLRNRYPTEQTKITEWTNGRGWRRS